MTRLPPLVLLLMLAGCQPPSETPKDTEDSAACDQDGDGACADDCAELDPAIHPGAGELCDGVDNNCDGAIDEGLDLTWYADNDGDGFGDAGSATVGCAAPGEGWETVPDDCDDTDAAVNPSATEVCDGLDNNCDGTADAGLTTTFYEDVDGDGFGDPGTVTEACDAPGPRWVTQAGDCDDAEELAWTDAAEVCDGVDNNCDGAVDEGVQSTFYADSDGDGYGDVSAPALACAEGVGLVADATDCDDDAADVHPDTAEVCNGIDDNCDGTVDEGVTTTFYADLDVDTHGDPATATEACTPPDSWIVDGSDCDDTEPLAWMGATEVCDGVDNDCSGAADEGVTTTFYADNDGDGCGDPATATEACTPPDALILDGSDCDDANAATFPGAAEVCNEVDDDCDAVVDDGATATWFYDADGDGHGAPDVSTVACPAPSAEWVAVGDDCDDVEPLAWSGATETGDGADNDCDGSVDEFREADLVFESLRINDVAEPEDGGWVIVSGAYSRRVASSASFAAGGTSPDNLLDYGHLAGDAHWLADVDGDGQRDLFTTCSRALDYPSYEMWGVVYASADVTVGDVECGDAVSEFGWESAYGPEAMATWRAPDGTDAVGYVMTGEPQFLVVPVSAFSATSVSVADAVASIDATAGPRTHHRRAASDLDGDGVDDLLLDELYAGTFRMFSAGDLDTLHIDPASASWSFDYQSLDSHTSIYAADGTDVNADGYSDIVALASLGASTSDKACTTAALLGPLFGEHSWSDVTTELAYSGVTDCGDMEILGDMDGDGTEDVAVGVQPNSYVGDTPGQVDIFHGTTFSAGGTSDPETERWMHVDGAHPADRMGETLFAADFDEDGTNDLSVWWADSEDEFGTSYESGTGVWFDVSNPG